jgi:hypothetical protein
MTVKVNINLTRLGELVIKSGSPITEGTDTGNDATTVPMVDPVRVDSLDLVEKKDLLTHVTCSLDWQTL